MDARVKPAHDDSTPSLHHSILHTTSRSSTAVLVPAARFCARGLKLWLRYPEFKGWRSAESRRVLGRHPWGLRVTRQARRFGGALRLSETLASRRSTVAILGRAPRFSLTGLASEIGYSE